MATATSETARRPHWRPWKSRRRQSVARNQIEYTGEDPWIRQMFEAELAKRGLTSLMPDEAYHDPKYEWKAVDL